MRHPESPRFVGALIGLGVIAIAAIVATTLFFVTDAPFKGDTSGPAPKPIVITELDNVELLEALGEPVSPIDCTQALQLQQQMTGLVWVDQTNGRLIVVCAP